jgi:hypothetical protein
MSTLVSQTQRRNTLGVMLVVAAVSALAAVYLGDASRRANFGASTGLRPTSTPAPFVVDRANVFEFEQYTNSAWGLKLSVPKGAVQSERRDALSFAYSDDKLINGRFTVEVERRPSTTGSAIQALQVLSLGLPAASGPETITGDGGRLVGALLTYSAGPGARCSDVQSVLAVFVDGPFTYALRVSSDAANRCDTRNVPQTAGVIDSLRLGPRP